MLSQRITGGAARLASRTSMKTASKSERIWRPWILVEIGSLLAVIALFNLFPQLIGIDRSPDVASEPLPFIATGFIQNLPWLNLWWGVALLLNLADLAFNIRTSLIRWSRLLVNLLGLLILIKLVAAGPIIRLNPAWISSHSADAATMGRIVDLLAPVLTLMVTAAISVAIFALGYSSLLKLRHLLSTPVKNSSSYLDGLYRKQP